MRERYSEKSLKVVSVFSAGVVQKIIPILLGLFVIRYYTKDDFSNFSYILVVINYVILLVMAGIVPSIYSNQSLIIHGREKRNTVLTQYINITVAAYVIVSIILYITNSIYTYLYITIVDLYASVFGLLTLYLLTAFLQATGKHLTALMLQATYFVILLFLSVSSIILEINFIGFTKLFFYGCMFAGIASIYIFYMSDRDIKYIPHVGFIPSVRHLYKGVTGLAIFNIFWMTTILYVHSYIKTSGNDYASFAVGYQFFSILVFLPAALSPLVIPYFTKRQLDGVGMLFRIIILWIFISLFLMLFLNYKQLFVNAVYGKVFSEGEHKIILLMSIAGVIAAINTPFIQFMVAAHRIKCLVFSSIMWGVINIALIRIVPIYSYLKILIISYLLVTALYAACMFLRRDQRK